MLFSMEAWPLITEFGLYSKKALFTIKISISHHSSPRSPGMLRKTGISPHIWWFWVVFALRAWLCMVMVGYGWFRSVLGGIAIIYWISIGYLL